MRKGFTLVELLAVIVILAVILVIAVPQINSVIKQTKKNSLASTAKLIAAKVEEKQVENEALGNNEALSCRDLVKLDNNYGSCTVSMVNGKGTVTIVGANKFAGITCTGTKDNMSCTEGSSNTPEYIYSGTLRPFYEYTYAVTEGKTQECITYLENNIKDEMINDGNYTEEMAQEEIEEICSNSDSTNEFFARGIRRGKYAYEDISSFLSRNDNKQLFDASYDYTSLGSLFIRWPGDTVNFDNNDHKDICIINNNAPACLIGDTSSYESNVNTLKSIFGESNCSLKHDDENNIDTYSCGNADYNCGVVSNGSALCQYFDVSINRTFTCSIENDGRTACNTSINNIIFN